MSMNRCYLCLRSIRLLIECCCTWFVRCGWTFTSCEVTVRRLVRNYASLRLRDRPLARLWEPFWEEKRPLVGMKSA
jgi:hypothetical protein